MVLKEKAKEKMTEAMESHSAKLGTVARGMISGMMAGSTDRQKYVADRLLAKVMAEPKLAFDMSAQEELARGYRDEYDQEQKERSEAILDSHGGNDESY